MKTQLLLTTALMIGWALPAHAQDAAPIDEQASATTDSELDSEQGPVVTNPGADIVVTGSYIRSQSSRVSPVTLVDSEALNAQAAFSPANLVSNLPVNSGAQNNTDGGGLPFSIGTSNVNLRGLGVSSTLTLLNGRRQVLSGAADPFGNQFVDLNSLVPTVAIQRVEVLKDGASSTYGSDAVAGVVNFITYKRFDGLRVAGNVSLTGRDGQTDTTIGALAGTALGNLDIVVSASFFDRTPLSAAKRDFPLRSSLSNFGNPPTFLVGGVPRPDPSCASVAATNPNVVAPPGPVGFCQFDFGDFFSLVAKERRYLGNVDLTYNLGSSTKAYATIGFADNDIRSQAAASQPVLTPPLVPANNPGNLYGRPIVYFGRPLGDNFSPSEVINTSKTWRATGGLRGDVGNLSYDVSYTHAENRYTLAYPDTLRDRFQAALNGRGGPNNNQFFNPLYGASNDLAVIDDFIGAYSFVARSKLNVIDAVVSTELAELPGGSLGIAVGGQYRSDSLAINYDANANRNNYYFFIGNTDFSGAQDVYAAFTEVSAPILDTLTLTGALRYEDFGDGVDTLDPKIGVLFRPTDFLSFRGTYGTSFRAPSVFQRFGSLVVPARVFDPLTNTQASISQRTLADPNLPLAPQSADTYNAGVTLRIPGLNLNVDYWRFEYRNFITPENASALVASNPNGPQIVRAGNTLTNVTTFFRNAGELTTDGLDFQGTYNLSTSAGDFTLDGNATRVLTYELEDPVLGRIDGLGNRNYTNFGSPAPKWRGNIGLLWSLDPFSANVYVRYIDGYDDDNNNGQRIDNFTTVDLQFGVEIPPFMTGGPTSRLSFGAKNLFDVDAPDALDRSGFDPLVSNPLGRIFYTALEANF